MNDRRTLVIQFNIITLRPFYTSSIVRRTWLTLTAQRLTDAISYQTAVASDEEISLGAKYWNH